MHTPEKSKEKNISNHKKVIRCNYDQMLESFARVFFLLLLLRLTNNLFLRLLLLFFSSESFFFGIHMAYISLSNCFVHPLAHCFDFNELLHFWCCRSKLRITLLVFFSRVRLATIHSLKTSTTMILAKVEEKKRRQRTQQFSKQSERNTELTRNFRKVRRSTKHEKKAIKS